MNRKRVIFNVVMLLLVFAVVIGSIMTISYWGNVFASSGQYSIVTKSNQGSVTVLRRGIGYELKDGIGLLDNDKVITSKGSYIGCTAEGIGEVLLDENSACTIAHTDYPTISIQSDRGTMLAYTKDLESEVFEIIIHDTLISLSSESIISVESYEGTQTINVYKGEAFLTQDAGRKAIPAGESLTILQDEDRNISYLYEEINVDKLSEFLIEQLLQEEDSYFTKEELNTILAARHAETERALALQKAHEEELLAQGGTVAVIAHEQPQTQEEDIPTVNEEVNICTIQIRCDTILDNLEDLTADKEQYVPDNGIILDVSQVEFLEGESVYDVLKRACVHSGINLSYDWTVEYGGYYIEGINHLYESDCGGESGWMFQVNGWCPNYGCSNYILKDGDIIVWNYTCNLGKDVGCNWMK